jgi:hypothetical protein
MEYFLFKRLFAGQQTPFVAKLVVNGVIPQNHILSADEICGQFYSARVQVEDVAENDTFFTQKQILRSYVQLKEVDPPVGIESINLLGIVKHLIEHSWYHDFLELMQAQQAVNNQRQSLER